jgi:hypothetical protein
LRNTIPTGGLRISPEAERDSPVKVPTNVTFIRAAGPGLQLSKKKIGLKINCLTCTGIRMKAERDSPVRNPTS